MARKEVSGAGGYFIAYYTIWLAPVKRFLVPFWELSAEDRTHSLKVTEVGHPRGTVIVPGRRFVGENMIDGWWELDR